MKALTTGSKVSLETLKIDQDAREVLVKQLQMAFPEDVYTISVSSKGHLTVEGVPAPPKQK